MTTATQSTHLQKPFSIAAVDYLYDAMEFNEAANEAAETINAGLADMVARQRTEFHRIELVDQAKHSMKGFVLALMNDGQTKLCASLGKLREAAQTGDRSLFMCELNRLHGAYILH